MKLSAKCKPTLLLVYDNEFKLKQVIFAPTQGSAYAKINLDNKEFISPIINGFISVSKRVDSNINCPLPISFPNYDDFAIRAFDIEPILWSEYIEKEKHEKEMLIRQKELEKERDKAEWERIKREAKEKKEELKRQKEIETNKRKQMRENRKKGNRQNKQNEYTAIFAYNDTGEVYKEYTANTVKAIAKLTGLSKNTVRQYYEDGNRPPVVLKYNKIKHIQKEIESRGLSLLIYTKRVKV